MLACRRHCFHARMYCRRRPAPAEVAHIGCLRRRQTTTMRAVAVKREPEIKPSITFIIPHEGLLVGGVRAGVINSVEQLIAINRHHRASYSEVIIRVSSSSILAKRASIAAIIGGAGALSAHLRSCASGPQILTPNYGNS